MPEGDVTIVETPIGLAWNLRGDPARADFAAAAQSTLGLAIPTQPNTSVRGGEAALLWLGPRSWLFVSPVQQPTRDFDAVRRTLNEAAGALFDVSSSYVGWTISGALAARVLNRGCPLDLHPEVFTAGKCAQSVLGHFNVLLHRPDERFAFVVMVARSFAAGAWHFMNDHPGNDHDAS